MLFSAILFAACTVAVPLNSRQSPSPLKCSNSTAATNIGAGILGMQSILTEINAFDGVADPRPIFAAQLALLDAKPIADQLGNLALFPTFTPKSPLAATAVEDLTNALAQVQKFIANITVGPPGPSWGYCYHREQYCRAGKREAEPGYRACVAAEPGVHEHRRVGPLPWRLDLGVG